MSRQFRIDDPAAFEAVQDRWIWGVNIPIRFRRLDRQNFHDPLISRLELVGDAMILEIERNEMPWAPGPVGNFRLTFSDAADGTYRSPKKEMSF